MNRSVGLIKDLNLVNMEMKSEGIIKAYHDSGEIGLNAAQQESTFKQPRTSLEPVNRASFTSPTQPQSVHPAAIWPKTQKYPLHYIIFVCEQHWGTTGMLFLPPCVVKS